MKFAKIARRDIGSIFKNRFIRVSVVAIIIVPLLYSLLYLAAFWDPYSRMDKLPIAVVNLDKGANNDGEYENAGQNIVDELKDNDSVGWKFVSLQEAQDGLEKDGYYSMFVIPEDFSQKVMSAKDGKPEKANIQFIPNDKKNFLASQIGGKVEDKLKETITASISKQYTEVTFDNLFDVKDGMVKAADGSKELADGNEKMLDGVTKLTDNIPALSDGVSKLYDGSVQAQDGVSKLYDGSKQVQDGVNKLQDGSDQVNNGVGQLKNKLDPSIEKLTKIDFSKILNKENLSKAQSALVEGQKVADMDTSMLDLITPSNVNLGLKTYSDVNSLMSSKELGTIMARPSIRLMLAQMNSSNPEDAKALQIRIANAQKLMADGLALKDQLDKIEALVPADVMQLAGSEAGLKAKFAEIRNTIDTINKMAVGINNAGSQMEKVNGLIVSADNLNQKAAKLMIDVKSDSNYTDLTSALANPADPNMASILTTLDSLSNDSRLSADEQKAIADAKATITRQGQTLSAVSGLYGKYSSQVTSLISDANSLNTDMAGMKTLLGELNTQLSQAKTLIANNQGLLANVYGMLNDDNAKLISDTAKAVNNVKVDLSNNAENLALLQDLAASSKDMQAILPKIAVVKKDLDTAKPVIDKLNNEDTLELIENSPELAVKLKAVQKDLKDSEELMSMAQEKLTEGNLEKAQALISAMPELSAGVNKLYAGTNQLSNGLGTLNNKMPQLSNGLGTLNEKMPQLSNGLGTLNSKIPELANGGNQLKDGAVKLADGSKELSDKLNDGANELSDGLKNSSEDMAEFVSEPFLMDTEAMNEVKNYGTGFTPYFIPLSLWVGAIMMFFVISPKVEDEIGAGAKSKVAGKYISYGFIGFLQATLVSGVVLTLGLRPNNIVMYFVFNILMSFTFIAIIQCLIFLLGDAGRLLAIVLLILQLTSCAGTFPIEVVPRLFQILKPFMPFTYAVAGLREAISGSDLAIIAHSAGVLASIGTVSLIASMALYERGQKLQERVELKKTQTV